MEISQNLIDFIKDHLSDDVVSLRLRYAGRKPTDIDLDFALMQIEARQKTRRKIPSFITHDDFLFPTLLSAEQASNEVIARFHASLVESSVTLLDLTAGLGIDDLSFALKGIDVTACEIDPVKCEVLKHNASVLGVSDCLNVICDDSVNYINNQKRDFDVIFADPARRNSSGGRLHALSDCQPDILSAMPKIMELTSRLLVKCSPLLDLSFIRDSVSNLHHLFVVCFKGECKEVLLDIRKDSPFTGVSVVDLDWDKLISEFHTPLRSCDSLSGAMMCNRKKPSDYKYLYEPNAGVMKTGAWASVIAEYPDLCKADKNTHLFLSDSYYRDFPGRVTIIASEPDKKGLKAMKGRKINVVSRNYPLSASQFVKKFSLIPGGESFLYAFRYHSETVVVETLSPPYRRSTMIESDIRMADS